MERTVKIDGKEVRMRASALIPRLYRYKFGRDLVQDMQKLREGYIKAQRDGEAMTAIDLEVFENVAWLMMRHAGEDIPDSPEEWLDSMDGVFSVYEVLPAILELWGDNNHTTSRSKKK